MLLNWATELWNPPKDSDVEIRRRNFFITMYIREVRSNRILRQIHSGCWKESSWVTLVIFRDNADGSTQLSSPMDGACTVHQWRRSRWRRRWRRRTDGRRLVICETRIIRCWWQMLQTPVLPARRLCTARNTLTALLWDRQTDRLHGPWRAVLSSLRKKVRTAVFSCNQFGIMLLTCTRWGIITGPPSAK